MLTGFILIIYLAFISLGLPDAILGAAWPTIRPDMDVQLGAAGMVTMVIAGGTIVSSIFSGRLIEKLGTGKLTLMSCVMTAGALLGFSMAPSFMYLVVLAIPLGLGGGAVDTSLNHYVSEYYEAHHMNWLHSFWGVGATMGPLIMAYFIANHNSWRRGYIGVASIQFLLVLVLIVALPLWKKVAKKRETVWRTGKESLDLAEDNEAAEDDVLKINGVKYSLATFLFYCAAEATVGLWGASYLVETRGLVVETAASWVALYYGGITVGRMVTGFITMKVDNRHLILYGQLMSILGVMLILLPLSNSVVQIGLILIGLGLAPIFPGLIHETPKRFGKKNSAKLIGYQMAMANVGITFLPPIFGLIATKISIGLFPIVVLLFLLIMTSTSERINDIIKK